MCSIRLSEPLLKLRPRKDLVETLLHEMIHAYLFVTNNDKDREGHGPEFCKHMHRLNHLTGANITIYHTFHDEVDEYRRHWWRCSGPCQHRQPYYGYVKRATNRAPSCHDYWWAEHQKTCGGMFIKIKEPENYSKKGRGKMRLGKQPLLAVGRKDKPSKVEVQPLTPFSGKGYVVGNASISPSSGKLTTSHTIGEAQSLSSLDLSANAPRPDSNIGEFEQNVFLSKKSSQLVSPVPNTSHQSVLSSYFPRVSVANQKAFRGVKNGPTGDITKQSASSGSQKRVPSSRTQRSSSKAMVSASASMPCEGSGSEDQFPSKRPREDKTAFDNFFIKKEKVQSGSSDPKSSSCPATTAQSSSSSRGQNQLVSCPVCQGKVLEAQINEHLDGCLEGVSTTV